MIGWKSHRREQKEDVLPKGYDDFELRLGDVMRGERATMGKSLLDVQRELRIKAAYIAAIENCDSTAFETPGFIAGYVRSYARYLNLDPDETFAAFCAESGYSTSHGMSDKASSKKKPDVVIGAGASIAGARDPFAQPNLPFAPGNDRFYSSIDPSAIGSSLVLVALICGIGYGGWSVLQEVQRVQVSPVEQTPVVLADLDPVEAAKPLNSDDGETTESAANGVYAPPSNGVMDRLYRPQALDVPVLIARDAPISSLDPRTVGSFAAASARPKLPQLSTESPEPFAKTVAENAEISTQPQVLETAAPGVTVVAVRTAWVRVRGADGTTLHETTMQAGDTYSVPQLEDAPTIRVGDSGAVYFAVNGQTYGPVGRNGAVTSKVALSIDNLTTSYQVADITADTALSKVVAELNGLSLQNGRD